MVVKSSGLRYVAYVMPFMAFMVVGWYGLGNLVQSKRELRGATQGIDSVQEMDPMERMRKRHALRMGKSKDDSVPITTLEDELASVQKSLDISSFEYVPVPRPRQSED